MTSLRHRTPETLNWGPESAALRRPLRTVPSRHFTSLALTLAGIGLGAVVAITFTTFSWSGLHAAGGWWLYIGRLSGMIGAYGLLMMTVLIARVPVLEKSLGQDHLVRWHRVIAPYTYWLLFVHVITLIVGYAQMQNTGLISQTINFIFHYPDMLAAFIGFGLLTMAAATSIRQARRKMKYETWWSIHLYTYLGLALVFFHEIRTGVMFIGHPLTTAAWEVAWAGVGALVLIIRIGQPIWRNIRWQLKVTSVTEVAPKTFAIVVEGRHLQRMALSGGQFFQWRFMTKGLWTHSHPYSISALPRPPFMRLTVKSLGDQSSLVATLRPGTRVFAEGPYGAFTHHKSETKQVVMIAAGIGITPLRSLLEDLPHGVAVNFIMRANAVDEIAHRDEIRDFVAARAGSYTEVIGLPNEVPFDGTVLTSIAPAISTSDVFMCGPDGFMNYVQGVLTSLNVPVSQIHYESFTF